MPRRDVEPARVLVCGGGIGGLTAALALARRGIPSTILERREEYAEEGAGIQIGPNGTAILRELGVATHLEPSVGVPQTIEVHDGASGARLTSLPLGSWIANRHGAPYWVAHRQDLHAALLAAVRETALVTLERGAEVRAMNSDAGAVRLDCRDGRSWAGSVLIGSDGIWSTTRRMLFTGEAPSSTGIAAVRTTIRAEGPDLSRFRNSTFVWMRPDAHLVHYPVRAGQEIAVVLIINQRTADTDWSNAVETGWVMQQASRFPADALDLLRRASQWRRWSLFRLQRPFDVARSNAALIGDAAHPVLPFLAQGAVLAMEDAVTIADALAKASDVPTALETYAQNRRDRVTGVAEASRRNGRIYHLGGMAAFTRNAALRLLPGERVMAGYDWLYGWKPASG